MNKRELFSLKIPQLPKTRTDAVYRTDSVQHILRSAVSPKKDILIVAFYDRPSAANGFSQPTGVLYLGRDGYTTRVTSDGKSVWRDSRIRCAMWCDSRLENVCLTGADERRICKFLMETRNLERFAHSYVKGVKRIELKIEHYQDDILERRRNIQKKRTAAQVDVKMRETPKLPKSFDAWVDRWPLLHSRYAYYRRVKRNQAQCVCTHCKGNFEIAKPARLPKHNDVGTCPLCGSKVTFKAAGRTMKLVDFGYLSILQRTRRGEMLLRFFDVTRCFGEQYLKSETTYHENGRLFFDISGNIIGKYKYGWSAKTGRHGWYESGDTLTGDPRKIDFQVKLGMYISVPNVWFRPRYLYHYNLHAMLKRLNLSYEMEATIRGHEIDVTSCIFRSTCYPFALSLSRIGLGQVRDDLLDNYISPVRHVLSGPLHVRLGISKKLFGLIRERCAGVDRDKLIEFGISEAFLDKVKEKGFGMDFINLAAMQDKPIKEEELLWFYEKKVNGDHLSFLRKFTTYHKIIKYARKQNHQKRHYYSNETYASYIIGKWKDYLGMCEKLGYDTRNDRVVFPKNLRDEHDKLVQLIRVKFDPEMDAKIKALYPSLEAAYHFEDEHFLMRPPMDFNEFIDEGVNLLHCVCTNGYYKGHVDGTNLIFFIRKKEDPATPFYTLEYGVSSQSTRQLRGYRDESAPQNVRQFTDAWLSSKCLRKKNAA